MATNPATDHPEADPLIRGYLRALERQVMALQLRKPAKG